MSKKKITKKASKKTPKKSKKKLATHKKLAVKKAKKSKAKKKSKNYMEDSWESPVWIELKNRGIDYAILKFEGGGDDGCIYDCELHANGKVEKVEYFDDKDSFIKSLGDPIWERYSGFNWFDHCSGSLTWNVANNKIEWNGKHEPEGDY